MDAYEYLPGSLGDVWQRLCGETGDGWERLAGTIGDAWERLIVACSPGTWWRVEREEREIVLRLTERYNEEEFLLLYD